MTNNTNIVEFTLACVETIGRKNTEFLAEWYPELFETPCEGWKVEEFFHLFETEAEAYDYFMGTPYFSADEWDELCDDYMVLQDKGLDGILVIE